MRALVKRHVNCLRSSTAHFERPPYIVLMVESNLGLEAAHVANMFRDDPQVVSLRETGPGGKFGVLTTHQRKMEFVALLEQLLLQNAVAICARVISDDAAGCIETLRRQLYQYRMVCSDVRSCTPFNQAKVTYSGKVAENGKIGPSALQDDLCIALQLAVFWSTYVVQRKCKFLDYTRLF